jgi:hypothetical protein
LLNSAAILFLGQAILILQPTHTPDQKRDGTHAHAGFAVASISGFLAAFVIIEVNKFAHNGKAHPYI